MSEYGSTFREAMKRSMSKPAAFKPLNRRDQCDDQLAKLIVVFVAVLFLGVAGVILLDRVEAHFRPAVVALR